MTLRPETLSVARLDPREPVPGWAAQGALWSVVRSANELSIVCGDRFLPAGFAPAERGWRVFELAGPLPFALTGVLASVLGPLAEAGVPIFAFSTYDTDYVMVPEPRLAAATEALRAAGHVLL